MRAKKPILFASIAACVAGIPITQGVERATVVLTLIGLVILLLSSFGIVTKESIAPLEVLPRARMTRARANMLRGEYVRYSPDELAYRYQISLKSVEKILSWQTYR
jgi:hypothetical protein